MKGKRGLSILVGIIKKISPQLAAGSIGTESKMR